jgi:1,4-dihydroxy-2-naphthoate polyprenyltransferase
MSAAAAMPSWRVWLLAARPATLPAAWAPVLVGIGAAAGAGAFRPVVFIATLAASTCIQIGTNFANDVSDFHRGADAQGRLGPLRVTQTGLATPAAVQRAMLVAFASAALFGLYLVWVGGLPILAIGLASIVAGYAYTGGPWPFGYHGLGDVFVFVFFGLLAVVGTYLLQTDRVDDVAVAAGAVVGTTVTAILVANNLRDVVTDAGVAKHTLAVLLGPSSARAEFALLVALAYLLPIVFAATGIFPWWSALVLLSLPLGLSLSRSVLGGLEGPALNLVLRRTAQLHLLTGVLLAIGLAL